MLNGKALHYVDNSNVLWREINYLHNDALHDIEIQRMLMTQLLPVTVKAWLDYFQYKKKKKTPPNFCTPAVPHQSPLETLYSG